MRSARVRLPRLRTLLTTWVTRTEWYTGSGISSRRAAGPLRGISGLLLGPVPATGLVAVANARRVEGAADDLVADAGKVLHPAAANQDDRVLLEVVPLARDVGGDLEPARQAHPGHLAQGGVRLLRRVGVDARADAAPLGRAPQGGRLRLRLLGRPALSDQLRDRGHALPRERRLRDAGAASPRQDTATGRSGLPEASGGRACRTASASAGTDATAKPSLRARTPLPSAPWASPPRDAAPTGPHRSARHLSTGPPAARRTAAGRRRTRRRPSRPRCRGATPPGLRWPRRRPPLRWPRRAAPRPRAARPGPADSAPCPSRRG